MSASLDSKVISSEAVCFGGTILVEDFDEGGKKFGVVQRLADDQREAQL
tara:strand:+ start:1261 stop:1407 length:147 start_codon:yes stop_codon:yes gene_type:complete